jgi:pimeloyl-ACP methyl ester carboxylesterase
MRTRGPQRQAQEVLVMDAGTQLARSHEIGAKVALIAQKRFQAANEKFSSRARRAGDGQGDGLPAAMAGSMNPVNWYGYAVDAMQRSILFWDTLRQRGNNFLENAAQGLKPVLHFDYDIVADGRGFDRPVNYALLRIRPPEGVTVDPGQRPYVIIDPRAGHGPGIGGFKDDSQVGVALRAGHPVYFVIFFRDPEPGQTLFDVCQAERIFVQKVRALHPAAPKPAIIGNCQGGWAAMMLAASGPDETGPIVINGAPMSYWGGAWSDGEGDNPMRYAGGMLGGTWLASLMADLGNGKFDGAHLVQNFENLNPANTFWDKYYHLFDKADSEPPRFLEFERRWGGYYLMNREEIEWITRNLFVGNKLWSGDVKGDGGARLDLREIKSPIILFASMGDNITPPQQAFNWVVDVYGSTEEIKARGQVIVGLLHETVGHLGIFVSGKVAKKEHAQIVSVLKTIESLAPGLYGMTISESRDRDGAPRYEVEFQEYRLEDVAARLNRFQRVDEKPFEAVAVVSEFIQRAYELFGRPVVQAASNDYTARRLRELHPLRVQNWAISDLNPWLWWVGPAAQAVKANRQSVPDDHPLRRSEKAAAGWIGASLDYFRDTRDAMTEAAFFTTYGNVYSRYLSGKENGAADGGKPAADPRELPFVRAALATIAEGGYVEALARAAVLLRRQGQPLPLSRLELRHELKSEYADYLPRIPGHDWRRIRGEQEIIVQYEPRQAVETLPALLQDPADRERFVTLLAKLMADERVRDIAPSEEQAAMLDRIRQVLGNGKVANGKAAKTRRRPAALKRA